MDNPCECLGYHNDSRNNKHGHKLLNVHTGPYIPSIDGPQNFVS